MRNLSVRFLSVALLGALPACGYGSGAGEPPPPPTVTVLFTYDAPTATDPDAEMQAPACVMATMVTHMHPSWQGFGMVPLVANGADQWTLQLTDVPVNALVTFRINNPNLCHLIANGTALDDVRANGTLLTTIAPTPGGGGPEPGFSLTVDAQGVVTP